MVLHVAPGPKEAVAKISVPFKELFQADRFQLLQDPEAIACLEALGPQALLETPAAAQSLQSCRAAEHPENARQPHGLECRHAARLKHCCSKPASLSSKAITELKRVWRLNHSHIATKRPLHPHMMVPYGVLRIGRLLYECLYWISACRRPHSYSTLRDLQQLEEGFGHFQTADMGNNRRYIGSTLTSSRNAKPKIRKS